MDDMLLFHVVRGLFAVFGLRIGQRHDEKVRARFGVPGVGIGPDHLREEAFVEVEQLTFAVQFADVLVLEQFGRQGLERGADARGCGAGCSHRRFRWPARPTGSRRRSGTFRPAAASGSSCSESFRSAPCRYICRNSGSRRTCSSSRGCGSRPDNRPSRPLLRKSPSRSGRSPS